MMRTLTGILASIVFLLVSPAGSTAQDISWPRQRVVDGNVLVTYQPQVDEWTRFQDLDWRMAFSLTPIGDKTVAGVAELHGRTTVENNTVVIDQITIKKTYFPSLDSAAAGRMEQLFRTFLPPVATISLQQFAASVPKPGQVNGVQLKNDPPLIFLSEKPAILLDLIPQPVLAPIKDTGMEYVVNTSWRLFLDKKTSSYYLFAGEQWLTAEHLQGPWSVASKLPKDMKKVTNEAQWADLKSVVPPPAPKRDAVIPTVITSYSPAEVILFDGPPAYESIPGTNLQYAANTTSYFFLHVPTNRYFYLTAGRWFSADSLGGPWVFATPNLPDDFSRIPGDSPAAQVLASVPGTEEAKDAVLLAQIPTTVTVNPSGAAAIVKVTYDGDPQFVPIEGTSLTYAKNTPQKVIRVGDLYYLCFQGIWFVSTTPQGPWQTASSVPQVIYTIPPGSPLYSVTYVTQVTTVDGTVQSSYTAGYTGVYVMNTSSAVVVVGGTGFYYPPYVGAFPVYGYPAYYPVPYTYGSAAYYHTATGAYGVSQTAYGPYGSVTNRASYNPYTGTYGRSSTVSTAYGKSTVGQAYNPYTGAYGTTHQSSNAYSQWGSSAVTKGGKTVTAQHTTTSQGTVGSMQSSAGGEAKGVSTKEGSTAAGKNSGGDMYAGHDGNVYRNTGSGWQKYGNGSWNTVKPPSSSETKQPPQQAQSTQPKQQESRGAQSSGTSRESAQEKDERGSSSRAQGESGQMQRLQQEAQNRQRGAQQSERFQQFQRGGGGGGEGRESRFGGESRGGFSGGRGRR